MAEQKKFHQHRNHRQQEQDIEKPIKVAQCGKNILLLHQCHNNCNSNPRWKKPHCLMLQSGKQLLACIYRLVQQIARNIEEYRHIYEKHIRQCTLHHIKRKQQYMSHYHQKDGYTFHLIKIFKSLHSNFIFCNQPDKVRVSSVTDILP